MVASNYKPNSEIALLNQRPLETPITISPDLYNILEIAKDIHNISDGFYDISLGKVSSKLGFAPSFNQDLKQDSLSSYLLLDNLTIIKSSNNWFDLSSIAKGYAVQLIYEYLIENNLPNHLIDIGGELIINGTKNNLPWKVGIQNPASLSDNAIYIIENNNDFLSIATSGEYRNYKVNLDTTEIVFDQNLQDTQVGKEVREERDLLLSNVVDPIVTNPLRWNALTDAKQTEWTQYRTDLLDIPDQSGFPNSVTWPTKPT